MSVTVTAATALLLEPAGEASGDAEWLAILRASEHPIHDELMAQRLRAELDEWGKR